MLLVMMESPGVNEAIKYVVPNAKKSLQRLVLLKVSSDPKYFV